MELIVDAEHVSGLSKIHERIQNLIYQNKEVSKMLEKAKYRLISLQINPKDEKENIKCNLSNVFEAIIYNYTGNFSLIIRGDLDNIENMNIAISSFQPIPSDEEFKDAIKILYSKDERIAKAVKEKIVRIYKPMPPLVEEIQPSGEINRVIALGIESKNRSLFVGEVLGIDMLNRAVIHYENENRSPFGNPANSGFCGIDYIQESTTSRNTPGRANITVRQGTTVLWTLEVVRPAASSGTRGSAVELNNVFYKGKKVLHKAHVPILNVRYDGNVGCGPYRDWQYEEGEFEAIGTDKAPGIRICTQPAKTIFESGNDNTGNFRGAAIYVKGDEVHIVSELEAGWYRYICRWVLKANGVIKPQFVFSAVKNPCVCNVHHHHVYWRFDFDIETAGNNKVEEFNDPILVGNSKWHTKKYEIRRLKDSSRKRKWRVINSLSGKGYLIEPGANDCLADSFGVGDIWFLKYRGGIEFDDGYNHTGGSENDVKAHLDKFITGESIENKDVVIWYGAHFTHDVHEIGGVGHLVGPILTPI